MNNNKFLKSSLFSTIKLRKNAKIVISNQNKPKLNLKLAKTVNININYNSNKEYKIVNN